MDASASVYGVTSPVATRKGFAVRSTNFPLVGVLSYKEITNRFDSIFVTGGNEANIGAAKYYLTLGERHLALPAERRQPQIWSRRALVLGPGQSMFVETAERLVMPSDLLGVLGPRYENSEQGVLFFGGMLVDPGYGLQPDDGSNEPRGQPLSFTVANVSNLPIEFRPGEDKIASIAFLSVEQPPSERELLTTFSNPKPAEFRSERFSGDSAPPSALGLVEDFGKLRMDFDKLQASVTQVVLLGVVVLAATLLSALTAVIFELTGQSGGPSVGGTHEPSWEIIALTLGSIVGGVLLIVIAFYLAVLVFGKITGLRHRSRLGR